MKGHNNTCLIAAAAAAGSLILRHMKLQNARMKLVLGQDGYFRMGPVFICLAHLIIILCTPMLDLHFHMRKGGTNLDAACSAATEAHFFLWGGGEFLTVLFA